jgi:hypothetical protein
MAFPSSHSSTTGSSVSLRTGVSSPRCQGQPPDAVLIGGDSDHQLEKLQFALAVALTRGDAARSAWLRERIAALGGNREEPGT